MTGRIISGSYLVVFFVEDEPRLLVVRHDAAVTMFVFAADRVYGLSEGLLGAVVQ